MLQIKEAIIVEGKYDRIKLQSLFDTVIIETGGFRIFKDDEKKSIIRILAEDKGVVLLTDSDGAGFVIRNFIKGIVKDTSKIKQAYIPDIDGKEKRKEKPSKEGLLGVEGMTDEIITNAVLKSGVNLIGEAACANNNRIDKADFFAYGLSGGENSSQLRQMVLKEIGFPKYMTANAMLSAVNFIYTKEEFEDIIEKVLRNVTA